MEQSYKHHLKFYPPHHFIFLPLMVSSMIVGIINFFRHTDAQLIWALFTFLSFAILYLAIMLRQHYALGNQNRIVRLEFYLRYFEFFGKRYDDSKNALNFSQIAALRFAQDNQFVSLTKKAITDNLSADEIKKLITGWKPDHMRV
jgi:hypothetical protein